MDLWLLLTIGVTSLLATGAYCYRWGKAAGLQARRDEIVKAERKKLKTYQEIYEAEKANSVIGPYLSRPRVRSAVLQPTSSWRRRARQDDK